MTEEPETSETPSGHLRWVRQPANKVELQQLWYVTTYRGLEVDQLEEWRRVPFLGEE